MTEPQTEDSMIAALLREREGLVMRGLTDRVAQVDEQLSRRGHTPPADEAPKTPVTTTVTTAASTPKGRRSGASETT